MKGPWKEVLMERERERESKLKKEIWGPGQILKYGKKEM